MPDDLDVIAGPEGVVTAAELATVSLVLRGSTPHTCAACSCQIEKSAQSLSVVPRAGRRWRLCPSCAPATWEGCVIAWGRICTWSGRGRRQGWDRDPGTPAELAETQRRREEAQRRRREELEDEWRRQDEQAAADQQAAYAVLDLMCEAAAVAVHGDESNRAAYQRTADALGPEVLAPFFGALGVHSPELQQAVSDLLTHACAKSAWRAIRAG